MTTESDDDIMESLFHGCALAAYVDQAVQQQGPPDSVATRQRAYTYYENALAEKNRRKPNDDCRVHARLIYGDGNEDTALQRP